MKYFASLALLTFLTTAVAADIRLCQTYENCPMGKSNQCTVSADSFHARYYYFIIENLFKNHRYQCQLQATPAMLRLVLSGSHFPAGVETICQGCPSFPVTLILDTHRMVDFMGSAILKYYAPPSDMPYLASIQCH